MRHLHSYILKWITLTPCILKRTLHPHVLSQSCKIMQNIAKTVFHALVGTTLAVVQANQPNIHTIKRRTFIEHHYFYFSILFYPRKRVFAMFCICKTETAHAGVVSS